MRARRAGTPPRPHRRGGFARMPGAAVARRGWAQSYRALPRAQPGLAPRRQTRPNPAVPAVSAFSRSSRRYASARALGGVAGRRLALRPRAPLARPLVDRELGDALARKALWLLAGEVREHGHQRGVPAQVVEDQLVVGV